MGLEIGVSAGQLKCGLGVCVRLMAVGAVGCGCRFVGLIGGAVLTVERAGVDTWSPCWYVPDGLARREIERRFREESNGGILREAVAGHRVGWVGSTGGLLWAEGHPAELVGETGLFAPGRLSEALRVISEALWEHGVPIPDGPTRWRGTTGSELPGITEGYQTCGFAGVRRCDATVDLRFQNRADGLAVLAGVAALFTEMRGQADIRYAKGARGIETAYLMGYGGVRRLGRWYDKGVETGEAPRGTWIRAEDQRRWGKESRRDVAELSGPYVRAQWQRRFLPLWRASQGVTVSSPVGLADKLYEAAADGRITSRQCESLCGYLLLSSRREGSRIVVDGRKLDRDRGLSEATVYRRRADLREVGLVLAEGLTVLEDVEVDLHEVIERALDEAPWGQG